MRVRRISYNEVSDYQKYYNEKHHRFISKGLCPEFDFNIEKSLGNSWSIINIGKVCGFFNVNVTEEVEDTPGVLIHNFVFVPNCQLPNLNQYFVSCLKKMFDNQKVYLRIENYLSEEIRLISELRIKHVYTSVTMLKDIFLDNGSLLQEEVVIRNFKTDEDKESFSALFFDIFSELSSAVTRDRIICWVNSWVSSSTFDPELYLFAEYNKEPVGIVALELDIDGGAGHLYEIGIKKEFRGLGIAQLLFHSCVKRAVAKGMKQLFVRVRKDNQNALRLFRSLGFKNIFERHYLSL
jgi:GNAT superfamily N-acetyltransferase